jgi:hypothetical protein
MTERRAPGETSADEIAPVGAHAGDAFGLVRYPFADGAAIVTATARR